MSGIVAEDVDGLTTPQQDILQQFLNITNWHDNIPRAIQLLRRTHWNLEIAIISHFEGINNDGSMVTSGDNYTIPTSNDITAVNNSQNSGGNTTQSSLGLVWPFSLFMDPRGYNRISSPSNIDSNHLEESSSSAAARNNNEDSLESILNQMTNIPNADSSNSSINNPNNESNNNNNNNNNNNRNSNSKSHLFIFLQTICFLPLILFRWGSNFFYMLCRFFPFIPRMTGLYLSNRHASHSEPRLTNPVDTARRFITDFEEQVGVTPISISNLDSINRIKFFQGGYTQVLYTAKKNLQWLIVYLQSNEHDDTIFFDKNTLMNKDVLDFLKNHDMLVWGASVKESEGFQVAYALQATTFPFIAIIAPINTSNNNNNNNNNNTNTNDQSEVNGARSMSVLGRIQGLVSPMKLIQKLGSLVERHEPTLIALRHEQQDREISRIIRQQQDAAYQTSLQADRTREETLRRQHEEEERQQEQERLEKEEMKKKQELRKSYIIWRGKHLQKEPRTKSSSGEVNYARVSFRLASGERIFRRFAADCDVEELYAFIECYRNGAIPDLPGSSSSRLNLDANFEPPADYEHEYTFELVSPMPRERIDSTCKKVIREIESLWPNGNLLVQDLEE